jgi:hypothetical protein
MVEQESFENGGHVERQLGLEPAIDRAKRGH